MKEKLISLGLTLLIICFIPIFITTIMSGISRDKVKGTPIAVNIHYTEGKQSIDLETYIVGVVAAEMPASYEIEALKAQAVAARTYTLKHMMADPDIVFAESIQSYYSPKEIEQLWDVKNYSIYYAKIKKAVSETEGEVILHSDTLIDAVFHAISGGYTQEAIDVWGQDIAYLQGVSSLSDMHAKNYEKDYTYTLTEFTEMLTESNEELVLGQNIQQEIQIVNRNNAGYVGKIQVGNRIFSGEDFRHMLKLSSSNFTLTFMDTSVKIHCRGYGHGVGMSQYGANSLAKEGRSYDDILKHYYTGVRIDKRK